MKSIPTALARGDRGQALLPIQMEPECLWVLSEGMASIKIDGTCCAIIGGAYYKRQRHHAEAGSPPAGWLHHDFNSDALSGHGWYPVGDGPEDRWHREASFAGLADGTYELIGPKVQNNRYRMDAHVLVRHGEWTPSEQPGADPEKWPEYLAALGHEGIVWRHSDGRLAKLKCRDFGIKWKFPR